MAIEINDTNYKELLESGKPVLVDFWATSASITLTRTPTWA